MNERPRKEVTEKAAQYEVGLRDRGKTVFVRAIGQEGSRAEMELTPEQALEMASLLIEAAKESHMSRVGRIAFGEEPS